ncbi:Sulfate adenylyltransferase (Sulfate adenylate transferase) (SAT) (ATP-sulfurylase) [Sulfobacillus acidophilus TPY]|nr:Sulfate adenylyltransferase (Sulfate adenylate transferase) (SAT) (ATP-sulfurylase) [Sulfobacillus acidophilus TPY]
MIRLDRDRTWDAVCLARGVYVPLAGFMGKADYEAVLRTMRLTDGRLWPLPITLPVPDPSWAALKVGDVVELAGAAGFSGLLEVAETFRRNLAAEADFVYGTREPAHPGVNRLLAEPEGAVAGTVTVVRWPARAFPELYWPDEVQSMLQKHRFRSVAFFQTRNPLHRAHEMLLKIALEQVDALVIHPLVGPTKSDDVSASVRMDTYRALIANYFPSHRVFLAVFPAGMRYAGPREALFHAIVRKNYGATHVIVGRDAAGVGAFYPPDAARKLVADYATEIGVTPLTFDAFGYCPRCDGIASARSCPHQSAWVTLSGTELRRRLIGGEPIPATLIRPEIASILQEAYRIPPEEV